jgi:hypothetical protein
MAGGFVVHANASLVRFCLSIRVTGTTYLLNNSPRTISCSSGVRLAAAEETITGLAVYPNLTTDQVTLVFFLDQQETA